MGAFETTLNGLIAAGHKNSLEPKLILTMEINVKIHVGAYFIVCYFSLKLIFNVFVGSFHEGLWEDLGRLGPLLIPP